MTELEKQIEAAFDFRGHVTVHLKDGPSVEGYLFNRRLGADGFIELFLKDSGDRRELKLPEVVSVSLTGEDCAAGKSYEDYMKKKAAEKKA